MYRYCIDALSLPFAIQLLYETIEIPASCSPKRLNVLGFLSHDNSEVIRQVLKDVLI
jgi:hypothetical protein